MISDSCGDGSVVAFLAKTWALLNDPQNRDIICWDSEGKVIRILNVDALERHVLPSRFRHQKIKSFIRQLNMYGFKKVKRTLDSESFSHPHFTRDNKSTLCLIQRRKKLKEQRSSAADDNSEILQSHRKMPVEATVVSHVLKREENTHYLEPSEQPPAVPLQPVYYQIHPYPYMFDDYFTPRVVPSMAFESSRYPFYGMLYR